MRLDEQLLADDQALIKRIKAQVMGGTITTMQEKFGMGAQMSTPPPLDEIAWAEEQIGFRLPALIREIWLQVGNGGFGPGYGITGGRRYPALVESAVHATRDWLLQSAQRGAAHTPRRWSDWQMDPAA
ncbi:MAG: hypothetical protein IPK17_01155 [Chloroflexi bacterium]|uniref:hypothetical protein n=1 Tax=Candidatus Flexifilum breve TaxID=3140694 RepID=UPI00313510B7|nr:hypothetical protein [Chloroflexota bacterium]